MISMCCYQIYNEENGMDVLLTVLESYTDRNERDTRDPDSDPDLHLVGKYLRYVPTIMLK